MKGRSYSKSLDSIPTPTEGREGGREIPRKPILKFPVRTGCDAALRIHMRTEGTLGSPASHQPWDRDGLGFGYTAGHWGG